MPEQELSVLLCAVLQPIMPEPEQHPGELTQGVRSRVQVRVSQDDSELLALGLWVARTAPGALLEMCCPGLGFGFRSHGWQRNNAGLAQGLILQGPGGRGWSGSILA